MKIKEAGSDVITLPRPSNQSGSCILHRLKLFDDVFRDIIKYRIAVTESGSYELEGLNKNLSSLR